MNSIAVMQPYFFPYIGYFQLIEAVDTFVFYDDVNYITRGWINRNKILINNEAKYITIPCRGASQNKLIYEVEHALNEKKRGKLIKKIKFTYSKAPFFNEVFPLFKKIMNKEMGTIADLAIKSIKESCNYLGLKTTFKKSSENYDNTSLGAADRLIDICKKEGSSNYINAAGGMELYDKPYFSDDGVKLSFLKPQEVVYEQFGEEFVPWLSIIDVMMFNSPGKIKNELLSLYKLV
jgi:hypothetical protein